MDLTRPCFDHRELEALSRCLASGWVTQGPFASEFERLFAVHHQVRNSLATTSCTAALHLAALALELGPGDEVLVPAFTWITSANCIEYTGAKAVFVDVELDTFNIDPRALDAAITPRTKAIVVVHLFGLAAKMDEVLAIARRHDLKVIEDAACAVGTAYRGRPVGGLGDIGCFSFHPRKVITTGEGGMMTTDSDELAAVLSSLRNHGATGLPPEAAADPRPYHMTAFDRLGYNLRMSDIQAAVGVAQMAKLDGLLAERAECARRYDELLRALPDAAIPHVPEKCGHTYQSYVIRIVEGGRDRRNRIMDVLAEHGIQTRPGTHAAHRLGYYRNKYGLRPEEFPNACTAEDTSITLPIFPGMKEQDQEFVAATLAAAVQTSRR
jgi:dTDP-4-amino-4,6-dideoxygalactose transaminase